jgi:hypothetical protein
MEQAEVRQLIAGGHRRRRLSLAEVRESGLPAIFVDYGETLLYHDNRLYNIRNLAAGADVEPLRLPESVLERGLGIEQGWYHLAGCECCQDYRPAAPERSPQHAHQPARQKQKAAGAPFPHPTP